jgi:hypothetical protein
MVKPKTITINGKSLTISEAKKTRDKILKGFRLGAWDKEKHKRMWEEYEMIHEELRK